jgi:RNA polymerase sigma-70 factor (ECF subfamily)
MQLEKATIGELWFGICQGNSAAQKAFYMSTYKNFIGICMRYAPQVEDAEQWVNDAYIKIFASTSKYTNVGSLEGWLKRLVVNLCLDNLRQLKAQYNSVHLRTKDPDISAQHFSVANDGLNKLNNDALMLLINALPQTQRTVFNMYVVEGYSHKEIAEELNMKEANSQWHLNRARTFLKESLEAQQQKKTNTIKNIAII